MACGSSHGTEVPSSRWSTRPGADRTCSSTHANSASPSMRCSPSSRIAAVAGVDHQQSAVCPRSQRKLNRTPFAALGLGVGPVGQLHQQRPGVALVLEDLAGVGIGGELVGREVAEVLVDPVRRQRRPHPVAPPRLLAHLGAPHGRGVPVVAHVVVVEDHRGGHAWTAATAPRGRTRRRGTAPTYSSKPDDLVVGPFGVPVAAPGDAAPGLRRELVGVDLVAEQQQRVGPLLAEGAGPSGRP